MESSSRSYYSWSDLYRRSILISSHVEVEWNLFSLSFLVERNPSRKLFFKMFVSTMKDNIVFILKNKSCWFYWFFIISLYPRCNNVMVLILKVLTLKDYCSYIFPFQKFKIILKFNLKFNLNANYGSYLYFSFFPVISIVFPLLTRCTVCTRTIKIQVRTWINY